MHRYLDKSAADRPFQHSLKVPSNDRLSFPSEAIKNVWKEEKSIAENYKALGLNVDVNASLSGGELTRRGKGGFDQGKNSRRNAEFFRACARGGAQRRARARPNTFLCLRSTFYESQPGGGTIRSMQALTPPPNNPTKQLRLPENTKTSSLRSSMPCLR